MRGTVLAAWAAAFIGITPAKASSPTFEAIFANGLRQSNDPFAALAPVPDLIGSTILVPFTDGNDRYPSVDTNAFYTYEGGVLRLHAAADSESDIMDGNYRKPLKYWNEFAVFSRLTPAGSFTASTAMGVRSKVAKFNLRTITLAFGEYNKPTRSSIEVRIPLDGPKARKLAALAAVEITLGDRADFKRPAQCDHTLHTATFRHPQEVDDLNCTVRAPVERIRVIRTDTGEELRSAE